MKIRELLKDESQWCQGAIARDVNGKEIDDVNEKDVPEGSMSVVSRCLVGWINYVYPDLLTEISVKQKVRSYLGVPLISKWNDREERRFEDILDVVNTLDI